MISLRIKNTAVCFDFSFFAAIAIFAFLDRTGLGLLSIAMCMLHESAHLLVMLLIGAVPSQIAFYGAGIAISAPTLELHGEGHRLAVYSAGCLLNFTLAAVFWAAGSGILSAINLCIGALNIMPFGSLDGARVMKLAAGHFRNPVRIERSIRVFGAAAAVCGAAFVFIRGGSISISALISGLYLMVLAVLRKK